MSKQYEVYKGEKGKTFVTVSKDIPKKKALTIANQQFKEGKDELKIQSGTVTEEGLFLGGKSANVWVVTRK